MSRSPAVPGARTAERPRPGPGRGTQAPGPSHKLNTRRIGRLRLLTGRLRILPHFLIIGAQKCGTSSLYKYLAEHPDVAPAFGKELHYFDWHFRRGPRWYRAHFPTAAHAAVFRMRRGRRLTTGEATPYYLFHPHAPKRVQALLPDVKLIALLRDPAERALSAFQHQVRRGKEPLGFLDAIERESERLAGDLDQLAADEEYKSVSHRQFSYLARGRYAEQLEAWLRHFPREQLLVLRSEDFFEDPGVVFAQVLHFLGLPAWQPQSFPRFNANTYDAMDTRTLQHLRTYFAPHNQRLAQLLGRDFGWPC